MVIRSFLSQRGGRVLTLPEGVRTHALAYRKHHISLFEDIRKVDVMKIYLFLYRQDGESFFEFLNLNLETGGT